MKKHRIIKIGFNYQIQKRNNGFLNFLGFSKWINLVNVKNNGINDYKVEYYIYPTYLMAEDACNKLNNNLYAEPSDIMEVSVKLEQKKFSFSAI